MKKNLLWLVFAALFIVSCSSSDESVPCVTVADCPDSGFVCLDGECVLSSAETGDSDAQGENGSGSDTSDDNGSNGGGNGASDDDNGGGNGLPDPELSDDDEKSDLEQENDDENDDGEDADDTDSSSDDGDNGGESGDDADNAGGSDSENNDNDGENTDDENPVGQVTDCEKDEDCASNINNKRCDTALKKCVICVDNGDCEPALGENCDLSTHECVSNATCAAAIAKLPHGGKYDWEDGTTQGFSTNDYWKLVSSTLLPDEKEPVLTHGENYSFGTYSGYTDKMDYTSVIQPTDLSLCSACGVKVHFYVRGRVPFTENGYDFIQPTCNGEGTVTARNLTGGNQTYAPQLPWVDPKTDTGYYFYSIINNYSNQKWTELSWTLDDVCKTDKFVFGLRFSSNDSISYATHGYQGLVVDNLTIAPAATAHEPNGAFESAANGYIKGWACDLDNADKNVLVKVEYYKNKNESAVAATRWVYANIDIPSSPDSPLIEGCNATYNHGFEVPLDDELAGILDLGTHSAAVFAVDIPSTDSVCAGTYKELGKKEFEVTDLDPK